MMFRGVTRHSLSTPAHDPSEVQLRIITTRSAILDALHVFQQSAH